MILALKCRKPYDKHSVLEIRFVFNITVDTSTTEKPQTEKPPLGKPTYDDCCEDLLCWENCFVDPPPEFKEIFNQIYKVFHL